MLDRANVMLSTVPPTRVDRGPGRMRVLASAFACGPRWGSEVGMGWNWVIALANHCQLTVIVEKSFEDAIRENLPKLNLRNVPVFRFLDIGQKAMSRFWRQNDWRFYRDYRAWQGRAYHLASHLIQTEKFDLVHQLNMVGYREPGYLWRLPLPFVWGPVGGHAQMPWRFLPGLGLKGFLYHSFRNVVNAMQMRWATRVRAAARKARAIIVATPDDEAAVRRIHGKATVLISETGTNPIQGTVTRPSYSVREPLRLCWCGKFAPGKGLAIALRALAKARQRVHVRMTIIGDGPDDARMRSLAVEIGIASECVWTGRIDHGESLEQIKSSHCLFLTSLLEATSTVVMEALSSGVPVICHASCGFGAAVDQSCGLRIPMVSPRQSVEGFADAIVRLCTTPSLVDELSVGAVQRASAFTWDSKAARVVEIYSQVLSEVGKELSWDGTGASI